MMTEPQLTRISKTLSFHLRHRPDALGLTLGPGGWVVVDVLLVALARHGRPATRAELDEVLARNPKQRFAFDETGTRIRASVDAVPPKFLQGETTSATAHLSIFDARADSDAELQRSDGGPNEH